jgi:hypothetical protein
VAQQRKNTILRRARVLATAGAALLLASCSSQPNDLRDHRYYADADTSTAPPSSTASAAPQPMPAGPPPSAPPRERGLDEYALGAAQLSGEGVHSDGPATRQAITKLPDCNVSLGDVHSGYETTWTYPTGATLRQYVAEYGGPADEVLTAMVSALKCGKYKANGVDVTVRTPVRAADGQVTWCTTSTRQGTCTAVRAHGSLLSVVTVTAGSESKAQQAVTRIAPLAATALDGNS